jgi:hypothetical protein
MQLPTLQLVLTSDVSISLDLQNLVAASLGFEKLALGLELFLHGLKFVERCNGVFFLLQDFLKVDCLSFHLMRSTPDQTKMDEIQIRIRAMNFPEM